MQLVGDDFDFAGKQIRIGLLPLNYFAFDGDYEFAAHLFRLGMRFRLRFFVEDHLDDSSAIAHVEEEEIAKVAAAMDPAENNDVLIGVRSTECAAVVSAFQIA